MKKIFSLSFAKLMPVIAAVILMAVSLTAAQNNKQRDLKVKNSAISALPTSSKRYALIVGVDQYDDPQIPRLEGASNDAKALADALISHAGFPKDQVILLASDQPGERRPTRGNMRRYLSNLLSSVPKDGLLLISFSGHGIDRENHAFLLPTDAQLNADIALLEDTALPVERVTGLIRESGVRQVLILLDACRNNPESARGNTGQPLTGAYISGFNFETRNDSIEAFAILYATEKGQTAYEYKEKKQGYFSWALVEGLKGAAANEKGEVTLASLVKYIQEIVPRRVALDLGKGKQQRPFADVSGFNANDLVLANVPIRPASTAKPVAPTPPLPKEMGPHPLSIEAAEKAARGDYDAAISDYTYAIKLDPVRADDYKQKIAAIYRDRGVAKYRQADYEGALSDFNKAIEAAPQIPDAPLYNARGVVRFYTKDLKGAVADFTRAIEIDPKYAKAYVGRANVYKALGQKDKAEQDFALARQIDSNIYTPSSKPVKNPEVMAKVKSFIAAGYEKANRGDYDGAIHDYSLAINLNPEYATPYYLRGNAKFNKEYFVGFMVDYVSGKKIGDLKLDKEDYDALNGEITRAIESNPRNPILYQNRGLLYAARGDAKKAIGDFTQAINLNPKFAIGYMAKGLISIASSPKSAYGDLSKAIELRPSSGAAYFLRAMADSSKNDGDDFQKALELSPEEFTLLVRRSGALRAENMHFPWIVR